MNKPQSPRAAINPGDRVSLQPGKILQNRYRIVGRLGKGGMGAVYEAVDLRLDTTIALKETFAADERLRKQFEQEARLLARLNHPALPRVSDYFTEAEQAFLVMQFIAGADLAEIITTQPGPFPQQQVIAWADQLLDALVYLHSRDRQIIHRDIKPHNLKLTSTGQIALLDFGLAKAEATGLSGSDSISIFGYTRRYSPLEQIQDQGTSPQSDIYALGATLYHLLTGAKPPDALTRVAALAKSQTDPLCRADRVNRTLGPEIAAILKRAMAIDRADRYQTAAEFREAIRRVGRESAPISKTLTVAGISKSANDFTVNTTIVKKPLAGADPFDSYSILKPGEPDWLLPKPSRRPFAIVALLVLILIGGLAIFYPFNLQIDAGSSVVDLAKPKLPNGESEKAGASETKPEKLKVSNIAADAVETNHRIEKQKRRTRRTANGPPVPSLRSALPLPTDNK